MSVVEKYQILIGPSISFVVVAAAITLGIAGAYWLGPNASNISADQAVMRAAQQSKSQQIKLEKDLAAVIELSAKRDVQQRYQIEAMQRLVLRADREAQRQVAMAHLQQSLSRFTRRLQSTRPENNATSKRGTKFFGAPDNQIPGQNILPALKQISPSPRQTLAYLPPLKSKNAAGEKAGRRVKQKSGDIAPLQLDSVKAIQRTFAAAKFDLAAVRQGNGFVPRVYLAQLPSDVKSVPAGMRRKALFIKTMLPLILRANENLRVRRQRLVRIANELNSGAKISEADDLFIAELRSSYEVKSASIKTLLNHVDTVPPSLALAQAAEESGWGTSRFARSGNAIFGQRTYGGKNGLIPANRRQGEKFRVRSYGELFRSVQAYMHNLNSHRAYRTLRSWRARIRNHPNRRHGAELAGTLGKYSERGKDYVNTLRTIIRVNRLDQFDRARLSSKPNREVRDMIQKSVLAAVNRS